MATTRPGGQWTDGGGSSLELIDPGSDNDRAGNWAASNESDKAPWTSFSVTGVLDNGSGTCDAYEVMLLDEGECMLDNITINRSGSTSNRAENGDFENGTSGWDIEGNHVQSNVVAQERRQSITGHTSDRHRRRGQPSQLSEERPELKTQFRARPPP